jgi:iron(III) transport system permease protein
MSGRLFALVRRNFGAGLVIAALAVMIALPLGALLARGLSLEALADWAAEPGLVEMLRNTLVTGLLVSLITVPLAFVCAFALEHTRLPFRRLIGVVGFLPLVTPSLLPALALVYLFGRQGLMAGAFGAGGIYGLKGIVAADVFAALPHALVVLRPALADQDGRLYEQAGLLGAGPARRFFAITLPGAAHGVAAAALVAFALTIADIGAPKVIGGGFPVLSVDIYRRVVGQQNFEGGAISALVLLAPSLIASLGERWFALRRAAGAGAKAIRYTPPVNPRRDLVVGALGALICVAILGLLAVCQFAALTRLWPYDLGLTLKHFNLDESDGAGISALWNSVLLGAASALVGTMLAFVGAWFAERASGPVRQVHAVLALIPAATPGLALGLAYVLAFNDPASPFAFLYGTSPLLMICMMAHFLSAPYLASLNRLKALDPEYRSVAAVHGRDGAALFFAVTAPLCAPELVQIGLYYFINCMTSVSAAIFLSPPDFPLASVSVLNLDDAGDEAAAAAMGMLIVYVNIAAQLLALLVEHWAARLAGRTAPSPIADQPVPG